MKILSVEYQNHPIIRNLNLDFLNPVSGLPFDNIVLAGENGIGKSTILKTLNSFFCAGPITPFKEILYIVDGIKYKVIPDNTTTIDSFHVRVNLTDNTHERIRRNNHNNSAGMLSDIKDPRSYGSVLSQARADFKTEKITHSTSKELDKELHDEDKVDNFTDLKQLLIDVNIQDNEAYSKINEELESRGLPPMSHATFESNHAKIYRFKKAFNGFFDKIKFSGIVTKDGGKDITFVKGGESISIDDLSTGEKQIVFRGAHLLKNLSNLNGATVFIDEPELSMHPLWQEKILQYYINLFKDGHGNQIAQIFFCTHSERVISSALKQPNTLVIVLADNNGTVEVKHVTSPGVLPTITAAETNYLAFNVYTIDYHIQLYGWLQEREGLSSVKSCDDFIKNHAEYDSSIHRRPSSHGTTHYETLSTLIRNTIDHPRTGVAFSDEELRHSTELLRKILS